MLWPDDADQHTDGAISEALSGGVCVRRSDYPDTSDEQQQRGKHLQDRTAVTYDERCELEDWAVGTHTTR